MSARSILVLAPLLWVIPMTALAAPQAPEATPVAAIADVQAPHADIMPANTLLPETMKTRELTAVVSSPDHAAAPTAARPLWVQTKSTQEVGPLQSALNDLRTSSLTQGSTPAQSQLAFAQGNHTLTITTLTLVLGVVILVLLL